MLRSGYVFFGPSDFDKYGRLLIIKLQGHLETIVIKYVCTIALHNKHNYIPVDPEPVPTDLGEPTVKGPFSSEQEHPYFHERPIRDYPSIAKSFPINMELDCAKLLLKTVEVNSNTTTYHEINIINMIIRYLNTSI